MYNIFLTSALSHLLKDSFIVPVPKNSKSSETLTCYKSVSLLNSLRKILELVILEEISTFLENNNNLNKNKFGYRRGYSSIQQLTKITDEVQTNRSRNKLTAIISIDLEKVFDTTKS